MDIIQQIKDNFLQTAELVLEQLEQGVNYTEFQQKLMERLNNMGAEICRTVLEASDQYLKENKQERDDWSVVRRDTKTILSVFGEVTYKRTYYKHKQTGQYSYLVDEKAGFMPHTRIDHGLKADLVEHSTELSYRKSAKEPARHASGVDVSAQSVLNALRRCGLDALPVGEKGPRRRVEVLYIEADEDHVSCQDGSNIIAPLIYVHEGKVNGRLQNPHYFSGTDPEELWEEVLEFIHGYYQVEAIQKIFIAGDGAAWIKWGCELFAGSIFVLDRYHLQKYIKAATAPHDDLQKAIWQALNASSLEQVKDVLKQSYSRAETANKQKAVKACYRYIKNHWEGVENYKKHPEALGCSAEAHVSHILSARLSSRPMGWSKKGAYQMARLRTMKANGKDLKEQYLKQTSQNASLMEVCKKELKKQRDSSKKIFQEVLDNLPALRKSNGPLATILRAVK